MTNMLIENLILIFLFICALIYVNYKASKYKSEDGEKSLYWTLAALAMNIIGCVGLSILIGKFILP